MPPFGTRDLLVRAMAMSFSGTSFLTMKSMAACVRTAWLRDAFARSFSASVRALRATQHTITLV
eukprot:1158240-Pelagomonas_calceolata.AAC.4